MGKDRRLSQSTQIQIVQKKYAKEIVRKLFKQFIVIISATGAKSTTFYKWDDYTHECSESIASCKHSRISRPVLDTRNAPLCSLVRKYFFLTSDSITIFAHYFFLIIK
jgi:hypothetical protein